MVQAGCWRWEENWHNYRGDFPLAATTLLKKPVTHLTSSCVLRGLSTYNVILVTVIPMLTMLRRSYHMIDLDHNLSRFESATETAANGCK